MATMVQEPYVNHIPTMTGGIGAKDLHRFYRDFFIPGNPPSMKVSGSSSEIRIVEFAYDRIWSSSISILFRWSF